MSAAAALLDRLGRPGAVRLAGAAAPPLARLPIGLTPFDEAVGGGLPRGRLSEITGPRSAGRTGLACRAAASATRRGETIAWVDADDTFEPGAAEAAGVVLSRTLWVRPRSRCDAVRAAEVIARAGGFGLVVLDLGDRGRRLDAASLVRLVRAAAETHTTALLLAAEPVADTYAALGLAIATRRVRFSGGAGRVTLLDGVEAEMRVVRSRVGRPAAARVERRASA